MIYSICFVDLIQTFGIMRAMTDARSRAIKNGRSNVVKNVGQNAPNFFSAPKIKYVTKFKCI